VWPRSPPAISATPPSAHPPRSALSTRTCTALSWTDLPHPASLSRTVSNILITFISFITSPELEEKSQKKHGKGKGNRIATLYIIGYPRYPQISCLWLACIFMCADWQLGG
jgi:hypothetical protein